MRRRCGGILMPAAASNSTVSSSLIEPRSGVSSPAIILTTEVLPAPDGPNRAVAPRAAWNRTLSFSAPSCFSTSTVSTLSFPVEAYGGAPCEPLRGDQRRERQHDRHHDQPARFLVAARDLRQGVD